MFKIARFPLITIIALVLSACKLVGPPTPGGNPAAVKLTVQTQSGATTFSQVGELITYNYVVTNTGTPPLAGPVILADGSKSVTCPDVNTVGNLDHYLDQNETIICTASYTVTDGDVTNRSITNLATATVGGAKSNPAGITLTLNTGQPAAALFLEITASPQTYAQAGQVITYFYRITNTGTATLGPAQFAISDERLGAPFSCGPADITLTPNQNLNCSAVYTITQADISLVELTNRATASGGGQTSAVATVTITNLNNPSITATPTVTLAVPGTVFVPTSGTPLGATPAITGVPPIRISFGPGETTATQVGIVNPKESIVYVVSAAQGQQFRVRLTSPANAAAIGITDPTGLAVKALDASLVWSTSIQTAGDYFITIASLADTSTAYVLEVSLSPAVTATPSPVSSPTSQPP